MTIREFIQAMLLIFCMLATGIILPIGLVAGGSSQDYGASVPRDRPSFIFK